MSRRRRTTSKRFWMIASAVVAVPLLVGLLFLIVVNPNNYRPNIEAAVKEATGRELKINGDITIGFGLSPTIEIHQIEFANPPGFSRNSMASVGSIEADVSLISLIFGKLDIGTLNIYDADVQFEVNPLGQSNTVFGSPDGAGKPGSATANTPLATAGGGKDPTEKVKIGEIGIYGGRVASRNDQLGVSHQLTFNRTVLHTEGKSSPVSMIVDVEYDGTPIAFTGSTGPVARLLGVADDGKTWPLVIDGTSRGAQFSLHGAVRDPVAVKGYTLDVTFQADDLSNFSRVVGVGLPPIHNLRASFNVSDASGFPDISGVVMRAESSDLSSYIDGLSLDRMVLTAPSTDQPIHAEMFGKFSQQPMDAVMDVGATRDLVRALATGAAKVANGGTPMPISITSHVAGADLQIKGQIGRPNQMAGLTGRVEMHIPDLTALSALAGQTLPALRNLSLTTDIASLGNDSQRGVALQKIAFSSSIGDIAGDIDVITAPRLAVRGAMSSRTLDLDGLQTASARAAPVMAVPSPSVGNARVALTNRRVIPEAPIDFSPLTSQDVDLTVAVGDLRLGGIAYRDMKGHILLSGGKLAVEPFSASLPGGRFDLKLAVDSTALPPEMSVVLNAPGVALKPILSALGQPDDVTGTLEIAADLAATGRTQRAIAGSLTGRVGMAMVDGELDNRLLGSGLSEVLRVARLPSDALIGGSGGNRTRLRCAAVRIDSVRGLATLNALVLQTSVAQLDGNGAINLAEEGLNLRLRPALRTVGPTVPVPVRVNGSFAVPIVSLDAAGAVEGVAGSVTGGLSSLARNPFGAVAGAAASVVSGDDVCAPGLAAARAVLSAR